MPVTVESSFVRAGQRSIAVRRSGSSGPAVLFIHGNSCSSRCFDRQLASPLAARFRLFAVDLPGHGDSPPATLPEETYNLPGYAAAIVAAATELDVRDAVVVGWSLGGYAVVEAIPQLPRARGFLLFGAPPIASNADLPRVLASFPEAAAGFREDSTDEEVRALCAKFFLAGFPVPEQFVDDFRRTDKRARSALAASIARNQLNDGVRTVAEVRQPLAIVHGAHDAVAIGGALDVRRMPTLWRRRVNTVTNAGHAVHWEAPEVFNQLLGDFVQDCTAVAP